MTLAWIQPDLKQPVHVLRDDAGNAVARLEFALAPGMVWNAKNPQRARATAGAARWTFSLERSGFAGMLGLSATIVIEGSHSGRVKAGANFVSAEVTVNGDEMKWRSSTTRPGGARFTLPDSTVLLQFAPGAIQDHVNTTVEVAPQAAERGDRWLLSALGLYLRVVGRRPFR